MIDDQKCAAINARIVDTRIIIIEQTTSIEESQFASIKFVDLRKSMFQGPYTV
jgi:hypothetical protein